MKYLLKFLIKKNNIITFDIFDTLIERNVDNPSDVFFITGQKVLGSDKAEMFKNDRKNAEKKARSIKETHEVTLDEIYMCFDKTYNPFLKRLKDTEIATEMEVCYPKKDMIDVLNYACKYRKDILLISDMYLSQTVIKSILDKCKIKGYSQIYISNEYGVNKISGKLFSIVIEEKKLDSHKILHIGDSIKADFIGARKAGIHSYLIGRKNRFVRILNK